MTIADFVSHLQSLDVRLSAEGERLRLNAPQGVLTDSLRSQVAERKQELLVFLRDNRASATSTPPPVVRRTTGKPAPLSFAQERLWFLEQLEPGSPVYNICRTYRLKGKLNVFALEASLKDIERRHEILRSAIRIADGQPLQVTESPHELKLCVVDLKAMSEDERQTEMRQRIQHAAETPFDFSTGKFLRAELLRIRDDEHILILTTHHMVSDAWSMGILSRELWSLYKKYAAGKSSDLPELPIQYADFAVWQREWLQGRVLGSHVSYWKKQLKDLPILNLTNDRPRPLRQSFKGAKMSITFSESLTAAINDLSNERGVTPFMTLLAAFHVLLYRYSGQEDIVVGSPIANRCVAELETLIGFFVNTLVLRVDLSGNPTFEELLSRVREVCLAGYEHQDLPFEKLVRELQAERDQSRNPLFQVMFALQNATQRFSPPAGLVVEPIELQSTRSPFDLSLFLRERKGKYIGYIEYSTDLFNPDRIERMAGHLQTLLEAIVADPDQSIATLPILMEAERHQILVEWNDTAADYPKDKCIQQLFEEQVERTPEAIAVEFENQQITYRELNRRANQLAHYLISLGVGAEKLVGICFERSVEMIIGLLGILKAGGAYVPLDPDYPKARLQFMVEDSQTSVILTQDSLVRSGQWLGISSLASGSSPKIVCLDSGWNTIAQRSEENLNDLNGSTNLAYVIYTSGSTGKPKGVGIEHRSVVNCLHSIRRLVELTKNDALLAVTTISFDIAVLELYLPLMTGAKIVLAGREETLDGRLLLKRLKNSLATMMQATPSTWKLLIDARWRPDETFKILCGGEALSRDLADQLIEGGAALWNLYGPTETTIWSTMAKVEPGDGPALIGRPVANTEIYILDSYLQPVPVGVHGEVYIGGAGLARGYLKRPELTAEKFVCDVFSDQAGARLYRTGDLARYGRDGNVEFLGRIDDQVKIRGHRIELGEVEHFLNQHPAVKESVVIAVDEAVSDSDNPKSLVAYIIPSAQMPSVTELRSFLGEKLPEYMIPPAFIALDALPLSLNGKIERSKLPRPEGARPEIDRDLVEPRSEIEELVAQIWREALKLDKIGIHGNFFELGGHSLLATQVIARLSDALSREIPLTTLFDAPTIAGLSGSLESIARDGNTPKLPPIVPVSRDLPLPLSMNQEHLWRLDQMMPGTYFFNMPYVYHLSGNLNVSALEQALKDIIRRHEALRTVFREIDGRPVQIIKEAPDFKLLYTDLGGESADEVSKKAAGFILKEREEPFDLASGPLLRAKLILLTNASYLLLVTLHHIISDDWSMRIFQRELATLYATFSECRASPLAEVPFQFADYAVWEKQMVRKSLFDDQLEYWEKQLAIAPHKVGFKNDSDDPNKEASFYTAREQIEVEESLFLGVRKLSQEEDCTPFTVFLAALNMTIHFYTGEEDIRLGIISANRESGNRAGVIGNFTNTIVLRTQIEPNSTVRQLLKQVRKHALTGYSNQELPFEYMAQILARERGENHSTHFGVQVLYNNIADEIEFPGLSFAPFSMRGLGIGPEFIVSNVDLIFRLRELSTKLTGSLTYKTGRISQRRIVGMIETFKAILRSNVGMKDCSLSSILFGEIAAAALQTRGWRAPQKE